MRSRQLTPVLTLALGAVLTGAVVLGLESSAAQLGGIGHPYSLSGGDGFLARPYEQSNIVLDGSVPLGTLDVISKTIAEGWSYDPDVSSQSIAVRFYVDGPYPEGIFADEVTTDILREDVNQFYGITGTHGFRWFIPWQFRDGQQHSLYVYGVDASTPDEISLLNGAPKTFEIAPSPSITSDRQSYSIGTWYFTAWSSLNDFHAVNSELIYGRHDAWGGVRDHALGADPWGLSTDYSGREPLLGFYNLMDQHVMDAHIRQAASSGLSFFAFYWYWNTDDNQEANITIPIHTFTSSSLKSNLKFLIAPIKLGDASMTLSMWKNSVVPFMVDHYISDSSYLTTEDGRPVVILFDLGFTSEADFITGIAYLRSFVITQLGRDPVLLWLYQGHTLDDLVYLQNTLDTDGFACFQLGPSAPAEPYTQTLSQWTSFVSRQQEFFHIPCASTGFDRRPWWKIGWGYAGEGPNDRPYNTNITLPAFANHLDTVKSYLDAHPTETSKTFIVYAWNEWGEGGVIEPSRVYGYQYLDTTKNTFGLSAVISRTQVYLPLVQRHD